MSSMYGADKKVRVSGTPIPQSGKGRSQNSEVVTYKLSEEELAKYKGEDKIKNIEGSQKNEEFKMERKMTITMTLNERIMKESLQALIEENHQIAVDHGWYEQDVPLVQQLALIHSEVSECLEADRKHQGTEKIAEELADVVIRTFDAAAANQLDLAGALFRKMAKNRERAYRHGNLKY